MQETIKTTTCSRTYKILYNRVINSGLCFICWRRSGRPDTGCNAPFKGKKPRRNWKAYRKFQRKYG